MKPFVRSSALLLNTSMRTDTVNANLLIDSIVRQTTILIAHLVTATGTCSPLAHTANQIFADLVRELREQGLGNRIIADMFGLSLRTYHNRVRRMSESNTERGRTLWEAVLNFVQQKGTVLRGEVMLRFCLRVSWQLPSITASLHLC